MTERIAPFLDFLDHEVDTDFTDPEGEIEIFFGSIVAEHRQQGVLEFPSDRRKGVESHSVSAPFAPAILRTALPGSSCETRSLNSSDFKFSNLMLTFSINCLSCS